MEKTFDKERIEKTLTLLAELLERRGSGSYRLIVCGGSALLVSELRKETTKQTLTQMLEKTGYEFIADKLK